MNFPPSAFPSAIVASSAHVSRTGSGDLPYDGRETIRAIIASAFKRHYNDVAGAGEDIISQSARRAERDSGACGRRSNVSESQHTIRHHSRNRHAVRHARQFQFCTGRSRDPVMMTLTYESTDLFDTDQLAIFIRGVDEEFTVAEELLSLQLLKGTTTGEDIFNEVQKVCGARRRDSQGARRGKPAAYGRARRAPAVSSEMCRGRRGAGARARAATYVTAR
ncbi:General transcription factor II-I repeat domain-containing protein 2A [Eumeta japonica]|uniref:General transcription factor II-I repeat domain-containing protein 2A n=1 Tax=Eumeta variegata TaxID=151549 RepID=A0A4C1YW47_EUMVA|nr:General transcription factor II-I repeat domain-containing protein 2A [Eumeta japonica]